MAKFEKKKNNTIQRMAKNISVCVTTYNRSEATIKSFSQVLGHPRVTEVIIVDDNSTQEHYSQLLQLLIELDNPKVKLFRNSVNFDCYQNKKRSVELATNEWVIIFDSDNELGMDYIDTLVKQPEWPVDVIFAPEFARPHFDYRQLAGNIWKGNIAEIIDKPRADSMINTCNYFVNRAEYLKVHKSDINPNAADTTYFNYCWIEAGNTIKVTTDLQYKHLVHEESHYKEHNHKSNELFDSLMEKFRGFKKDGTVNIKEQEKSVVTFNPMGRMGNWLFEFAAAFSYAKKHGLRFSVPTKTNDPKWNPIYFIELGISETPVEEILIKEATYFKFDELEFKPEWEHGKTIILDGYFQNPMYFADDRKDILKIINHAPSPINKTCSIHIRRGDFLLYTDKHPAFSDEYMKSAMDCMKANRVNEFKIFSDDIPWCRNYFGGSSFKWAKITFSEGKSEQEDLFGIADCMHHINSSSTFSWWGAWLNRNVSKIIITPEIWLLHKHSNEFTNEIIPSEWIKM